LVHHHLVQHPLMNLAFVNSNMDKASCCLLQSHQPPWVDDCLTCLGFVCTVATFQLKLLCSVPLTEKWCVRRGAVPMTRKWARNKRQSLFLITNTLVSPVSFHLFTVSTNRAREYESNVLFLATIVVIVCQMGRRVTRRFLRSFRGRKMVKREEKRIPLKWQSFHSFPLHCSLESVVITTMSTLQWRLRSNCKISLPNVLGRFGGWRVGRAWLVFMYAHEKWK
jgi:hypothetical protein